MCCSCPGTIQLHAVYSCTAQRRKSSNLNRSTHRSPHKVRLFKKYRTHPNASRRAPRSSDRGRHAYSARSRPKGAILCLFRENSKCVYTVNVKIRLRATLDFSTFESRPPCPRRCAPGRAPRASQGTAAARRKFSANMKIGLDFHIV